MASAKEWLKFFEDAGIPKSAATKYAVSFTDNRISFGMLNDLDKEYLRDLNVGVLGDIISILKHAKEVSARLNAQEQERKVQTIREDSIKSSNDVDLPAVTKNAALRLGPPSAKPFQASKGSPPPASSASSSVAADKGVFSRLGSAINDGIIEKPVNRLAGAQIKPSEGPGEDSADAAKVSPLKRRSTHDLHDELSHSHASDFTRKKRLVLVRTMPDGSQIKQLISPDDPLVSQLPIQKKAATQQKGQDGPSFAKNTLPAASLPSVQRTIRRQDEESSYRKPAVDLKTLPSPSARLHRTSASDFGGAVRKRPIRPISPPRFNSPELQAADKNAYSKSTPQVRSPSSSSSSSIPTRKRISPPRFRSNSWRQSDVKSRLSTTSRSEAPSIRHRLSLGAESKGVRERLGTRRLSPL